MKIASSRGTPETEVSTRHHELTAHEDVSAGSARKEQEENNATTPINAETDPCPTQQYEPAEQPELPPPPPFDTQLCTPTKKGEQEEEQEDNAGATPRTNLSLIAGCKRRLEKAEGAPEQLRVASGAESVCPPCTVETGSRRPPSKRIRLWGKTMLSPNSKTAYTTDMADKLQELDDMI